MLLRQPEGLPEPRIRFGSVYQGIEKDFAVPLCKRKALMPGNRLSRGLRERSKAKLRKAPTLKRSGVLHQPLGLRIYAKTQPGAASAAFHSIHQC